MSGDRQALLARSIAALDDPASIESRPLDEVIAELGALGVDPEASIAAAKKLASAQSSPADRLLARLQDGEEIDDDIERLENADLADIRAKVAAGVAASIAAGAKRQSGQPTNVARLSPAAARRWGGSVVGIAACLLLFVLTRPDQLVWMEGVERGEVEKAQAPAEATIAADPERDDAVAKPSPPAERRSLTLEPFVTPAPMPAPTIARERRNLAVPRGQDLAPAADAAEKSTAGPAEPASPAIAAKRSPSSESEPAPAGASPMTELRDFDAAGASLFEQEEAPDAIGATPAASGRYRAILILDSDRAPADLKEQALTLPSGDLVDRLDDARAELGARPIIALVAMTRDGEEVDAALTLRGETVREPRELDRMLGQLADNAVSLTERRASIEGGGLEFEFVDLPDKPGRP